MKKKAAPPASRSSKRFDPNSFTEIIVPVLLVVLVFVLLAVLVIIGLSLTGTIPA